MSMGSKKKQTTGHKYKMGMHMVICAGPIDNISEIFVDKKSAWKGSITSGVALVKAEELFGGEKREGGIAGPVRIMNGSADQVQNEYMSNFVQDVPAYRGVVSAVLEKVYLGMSPYLKNWAFKATRISTRNDGKAQWYLEKAGIGSTSTTNVLNSNVSIVIDKSSSMQAIIGGTISRLNIAKKMASDILDYLEARTIEGVSFNIQLLAMNQRNRQGLQVENTTLATAPLNNTTVFTIFNNVQVEDFVVLHKWVDDIRMDGFASLIGGGANIRDGGDPDTEHTFFKVPRWFELPGQHYLNNESSTQGLDKLAEFFHPTNPANNVCALLSDGLLSYEYASGLTGNTNTYRTMVDGGRKPASIGDWSHKNKSVVNICQFTTTGDEPYDVPDDFYSGPRVEYINQSKATAIVLNGTSDRYTKALTEFKKLLTSDSFDSYTDMNPAHIIRECLTDTVWGMGYPEYEMDDISFTYAADSLYSEGFGLSILWDKQSSIEDFIKEIVKHIDAVVFVDRYTGKFVLKLIRNDYSTDELLLLNESNVSHISDFSRPAIGELVNSVTVNCHDISTNKTASITLQDIALFQVQGAAINTKVQYPGITNRRLASRVAQRDLKTLATPLFKCTVYADSVATHLNIGDVFKLTWPDYGVANVVMRITGVAYGNGISNGVRLTATQDIFALPESVVVEVPATEWVNPTGRIPEPISKAISFETPYFELIRNYGQVNVDANLQASPDSGFVCTAVIKSENAANCNIEIDDDASGSYEPVGTTNFCIYAELLEDILYYNTELLIKIDSKDASRIVVGDWIHVDNEIMAVEGYTAGVLSVKRGCLDTVPERHRASTAIYFCDTDNFIIEREYGSSENLNIALFASNGSGQSDPSLPKKNYVDMNARAFRPYPPADVLINDKYYNADNLNSIDISWGHRNRKQQTGSVLLGFFDPGLSLPEPGVTYAVSLLHTGTLNVLYYADNIEGSMHSIPYYGMPLGVERVFMKLSSFRDGYECFTPFYSTIYFAPSIGGTLEFKMNDLSTQPLGGSIPFKLN